jgi:hypothetical protein
MEKFLDAVGATTLLVTVAIMLWLAKRYKPTQWLLDMMTSS